MVVRKRTKESLRRRRIVRLISGDASVAGKSGSADYDVDLVSEVASRRKISGKPFLRVQENGNPVPVRGHHFERGTRRVRPLDVFRFDVLFGIEGLYHLKDGIAEDRLRIDAEYVGIHVFRTG